MKPRRLECQGLSFEVLLQHTFVQESCSSCADALLALPCCCCVVLQDNLKDKQVVVDMTERKCQCLEEENFRLREENDRLRDELRFLRTEVRAAPAQLHSRTQQHMAHVKQC